MSHTPCRRPQVRQQSTGQAGPEINRDLEVLFEEVNGLNRCVGRVSDYLERRSDDDDFEGGGGGEGTPPPDPPPPPPPPPEDGGGHGQGQKYFETYTLSANWEISEGFSGMLYIQPTTNIDVTLPSRPQLGQWLRIFNAATGVGKAITVKDGASTVVSLLTGEYTDIILVKSVAGAPGWPASVAALS